MGLSPWKHTWLMSCMHETQWTDFLDPQNHCRDCIIPIQIVLVTATAVAGSNCDRAALPYPSSLCCLAEVNSWFKSSICSHTHRMDNPKFSLILFKTLFSLWLIILGHYSWRALRFKIIYVLICSSFISRWHFSSIQSKQDLDSYPMVALLSWAAKVASASKASTLSDSGYFQSNTLSWSAEQLQFCS